jgi:sugar phosphate isomerase/epimerase
MPTLRLSGFADEAADDIHGQLAAITQLGWSHIDLRKVDKQFVHDLPLEQVRAIAAACKKAGVAVASVGSAIANGAAKLSDPEHLALDQARRCAERLPLLNCTDVRIMSWPPGDDVALDGPTTAERFRRLRGIVAILREAGLRALHENCHNYGGQSVAHTDRLLAEVPGLELLFDNGNPVKTIDRERSSAAGAPPPQQSPWEFWCRVRDRAVQVHLKDAVQDPVSGTFRHCLPGWGQGDVGAIVADLVARRYSGVVSIEPHLGGDVPPPGLGDGVGGNRVRNFLAFGQRINAMVAELEAGALAAAR